MIIQSAGHFAKHNSATINNAKGTNLIKPAAGCGHPNPALSKRLGLVPTWPPSTCCSEQDPLNNAFTRG